MPGELIERLQQRWQTSVAPFQAKRDFIEGEFARICQHHSEKHRHYHTLVHLAALFTDLDSIEDLSTEQRSVLDFSVWYHDIIYQPGAKDNEAKSAELAVAALTTLAAPGDLIQRVRDTIIATAKHEPNDDEIAQLFLDADMAILGAPSERYRQYTEEVQREFKRIPTFLYRRGRKGFLKQTLEQEKIFVTDFFHARYEAQARENMVWEISTL